MHKNLNDATVNRWTALILIVNEYMYCILRKYTYHETMPMFYLKAMPSNAL